MVCGMWDLLRPGIELMSLALQGRFLTTRPPVKPLFFLVIGERLPTPVFWPSEFHGLYNPWGHKELDTTERLSLCLGRLISAPHGTGLMENWRISVQSGSLIWPRSWEFSWGWGLGALAHFLDSPFSLGFLIGFREEVVASMNVPRGNQEEAVSSLKTSAWN